MVSGVAAGALVIAVALCLLALVLLRWRRRLAPPLGTVADDVPEPEVDVPAVDIAEAQARAVNVAFDEIVGHLLLTDPSFVDTGDRLAGRDDSGAGS